MFYGTLSRLLNDVVEFEDDTPSALYGSSAEREARLALYYDRAVEEIWNNRTWWPFRHDTAVLNLVAGGAVLPVNFGGIGTDGYVVVGSLNASSGGSGQLPWVEVNYQEMLAMRNNNVWPAKYQQNRVYAIGQARAETNPSDGRASGASGSSYDLDSTLLELPNASVGDLITISGFSASDLNGLFTITTISTPNGDWNVTRLDGQPVTSAEGPVSMSVTTTQTGALSLLSGNPADDRSLSVYYDVQLIRTDPLTDLNKAIALPGYLHHAALAGTTWYANRSKNDKRSPRFREDFMRALSDGVRVGRLKANRPQQMPMSVGRMW
ncbi:MAG: hypothetical protein GY906_24885 [bacterium]|nr:hypothetical protein [bacterium]